jgi:amino acid adenylation domain-containing protein
MTVEELLTQTSGRGLQLRKRGSEIVVRGNQERLDSDYVSALRFHKEELLRLIGAEEEQPWLSSPAIKPEMLSLINLSTEQIDALLPQVPGGVANVEDIYPLAPLQEGILFHHLMAAEADPYVLCSLMAFDSRERLDRCLEATQFVIDRHDILRTGIFWEGLPEPVQVVLRQATLRIEEVILDPAGDAAGQLYQRFGPLTYRIDLHQAPLFRAFIAYDAARTRWLLLLLQHHLIGDHTTFEVLAEEIHAHLLGRQEQLPAPQPFRNFIAQARLGISRQEHEVFFRDMLGDVDEPTAPFGLLEVRGDGSAIREASSELEPALAKRMRAQARQLGVSVASLCHLAWALVLARTSGRSDVVFGTVLFGRMNSGEGADRVMGPFINSLPLRLRIDEESVLDSVRDTHQLLAELLRHEHASLALAQRCSAVPAPTPLFSSLLNYRHSVSATPASSAAAALEGIEMLSAEERSNYPFDLSVDDFGEGFKLTAQMDISVDPARVCAYMQTALQSLVNALDDAPETSLQSLEVLPAEERRQVLYGWNDTAAEYPKHKCVHQIFEEQVARTPDAIAVIFEEQRLSYAELNRRANQLAHHLRGLGVQPDDRVALCLERGFSMIIAILAVLKAGGAYVPLDPTYPAGRLRFVLDGSEPVALLTQTNLAERCAQDSALPVLLLDADSLAWQYQPDTNIGLAELSPDHLAYVIYTSGSTGSPKGVMVQHQSVVNRVLLMQRSYGLDECDVVLHKASYTFDVSVWEIIAPLCAGSRLVIALPQRQGDPEYLIDVVQRDSITMIDFVPALLQAFLEQANVRNCSSLRHVFCGGEALPTSLLRRFYAKGLDAVLHNMYGPTEATVDATAWTCPAEFSEFRSVPIGKPIANTQIYILDAHGEPAPIGVAGELYIGGAGVARGYLNQLELTAERFLKDPFAAKSGARMYKTGDLGRWLPDGNIEFVGRNDFQVKLRGFRIELGEIEARLAQHPAVREAVVLVREERLAAYLVATDTQLIPDAEMLRSHLSATLPDYMVPAAYVSLDALPLTANGKLDRNALPAPEVHAYSTKAYEEPQGETELLLARIWTDLLNIERAGRQDNFFELGGHSLLAVTLIERMRQEGLQADVRKLFTSTTLASFAAAVTNTSLPLQVPPNRIPAGSSVITPDMLPLVDLSREQISALIRRIPGGATNVQDIYPLAPLQEGILFHYFMATEVDPYLSSALLAFNSRELIDKCLRAMQSVVDRHDILRTAIFWEGLPEPVQIVLRKAILPVEEVLLDSNASDPALELYHRFDSRQYRIALHQAPLLRVFIAYDTARNRWLMLLQEHHLVGDHTAFDVLAEEIEALLLGRQEQLPAPQPFRNFVAQARLGISKQEHEVFFRDMLGDVDEPTAPFGLLEVRGDGSAIREASLELEPALAKRMRVQARQLGVSVASLCHLAWALVLARTSGRSDVVFGTVLFGRMNSGEGADRVMGLFINTLPVRFRISGQSVLDSVRHTHQLLAELLRHEHASLALAQRCSAVPAPTPLFSGPFNYRHVAVSDTRSDEAAFQGMEWIISGERTNYPVGLSVDDLGEDFRLVAQVDSSIDPGRICALMQTALQSLAAALEHAPETTLRNIDVLPAEERRQVLYGWNNTAAKYPTDKCVHQIFEEQVERTPAAAALVFEEQELSYAELNRQANQLAHHLRAVGVRPDDRVALCFERGFPMIVAILAVLKAGGAYVPLDPAYPADRLRFMLGDSQPVALLTQAKLAERFVQDRALVVLLLDADSKRWASAPDTNPQLLELAPHHLAYVIYTSGSTGVPKGVMVQHRGLVNLVAAQIQGFALDPSSRTLQFSSFSFDACASEIFTTLCAGASLYLRAQNDQADAASLQRFFNAGVTHATLPSAVLAALPEGTSFRSLRTLVIAGDVLPPSVANRWKRGCRLINAYGPTEATICATMHLCQDTDIRTVPIGKPIANTRIYILDAQGEPAPIGVAGELYIGGDGVASGYLNRPELTAERFLKDPFAAQPDERMYKTGDLGRWLPDGNIEFLGRNDFQVKLRGFRIELGEIEARLAQHPAVREAVVLAREERLVAYLVPADAQLIPDAEMLRTHLSATLPDYMVPAAYVSLDILPLTPNGKLDRNALPAPDGDAYGAQDYESPQGETETILAAIWAELLHLERVGRNDNFFELGGHSLLAVTMMSRVQHSCNVELELTNLFAEPTLKQVAEMIVAAQLDAFESEDLESALRLLKSS